MGLFIKLARSGMPPGPPIPGIAPREEFEESDGLLVVFSEDELLALDLAVANEFRMVVF
jgi:hypothetical protein